MLFKYFLVLWYHWNHENRVLLKPVQNSLPGQVRILLIILNQASFLYFFGVFLASKITNQNISIFTTALCRVAAIKPLPVHHLNADYIFSGSFQIIGFSWCQFQNKVLLNYCELIFTVKLQWLEHSWLVYDGCFQLQIWNNLR